jgi:hypothetical protein
MLSVTGNSLGQRGDGKTRFPLWAIGKLIRVPWRLLSFRGAIGDHSFDIFRHGAKIDSQLSEQFALLCVSRQPFR